MASLTLADLEATEILGRVLAEGLAKNPVPCFFTGPLGSGKTTLIGAIVRHLPGGSGAEPSSPSFTLCNYYPTDPPVLHCDLYRVDGGGPGDIDDFLAAGDGILMLEWAERLPWKPAKRMDFFLDVRNDTRVLEIVSHGAGAVPLLHALLSGDALAPFVR